MITTLLAALALCTTTIHAGDVVYHKGQRWNATIHFVNAAEGWVRISAQETNGAQCKVWIKDLDADTRVRLGLGTPGEVLDYNARTAEAAALAALKDQQEREAMASARAAHAAAQAQQQAAKQHAEFLALQRQALELQRRQTEAAEQAAFLQFLRSQQR